MKSYVKLSIINVLIMVLIGLSGCSTMFTQGAFTIDGVEDGGVYYSTVNPEISAINTQTTLTKTLNGSPYDGSEIVQSGDYTLNVVGEAGNKMLEKTYNFTVVNQGEYVWDFEDGVINPLVWETVLKIYILIDKI